jgi:hypothetical protein
MLSICHCASIAVGSRSPYGNMGTNLQPDHLPGHNVLEPCFCSDFGCGRSLCSACSHCSSLAVIRHVLEAAAVRRNLPEVRATDYAHLRCSRDCCRTRSDLHSSAGQFHSRVVASMTWSTGRGSRAEEVGEDAHGRCTMLPGNFLMETSGVIARRCAW